MPVATTDPERCRAYHCNHPAINFTSSITRLLIKPIRTYFNDYATAALYNANGFDGFDSLLLASGKPAASAPQAGKPYITFVGYDHKNELEHFPAKTGNPLSFPKQALFEAEVKLKLKPQDIAVTASSMEGIVLRPVVSRETYLQQVHALKRHIQLGDIYEINYCISFEAQGIAIDPLWLYQKLNAISQAPYSSLLKMNELYIISSSPELFLSKRGNRLYTKPIKGTARRGETAAEDEDIKSGLHLNAKERNENVMIVDVARNDLSRIARRGSVKTDELFAIESYRQVHQMVSTVSCELKEGLSFSDIIGATFPMASMTGAPKYRAMQLIDRYEAYNRGPYSGCLGYIRANGDFDLNVLIRSVFYDASKRYLSFTVGSAITDLCRPEDEYAECLLKAKAMVEALGAKIA